MTGREKRVLRPRDIRVGDIVQLPTSQKSAREGEWPRVEVTDTENWITEGFKGQHINETVFKLSSQMDYIVERVSEVETVRAASRADLCEAAIDDVLSIIVDFDSGASMGETIGKIRDRLNAI